MMYGKINPVNQDAANVVVVTAVPVMLVPVM
jgi:hypothetical protein